MRILIVHNTLNDSRSVSGVLRHYGWMANEWTAAGHQTDFLAAKAGWPQIASLAPNSRLLSSDSFFNATRYLAKTYLYFPAYGYRMLSAHLTRLREPYDVIYASTQLIVEVYAAMVLARRYNAKLAAKIHHVLAAQSERTGFFDRLFLWSERRTTRWMNRHADLIFCGTELVAKDFHVLESSLGLPRRETVQVGYGIDLSAIPSSADQSKKFDVVVLGRMHEHKGVFDLPYVWQKVIEKRPESRLLVIGEGPHRQQTEALFKQLGLQHTALFTGGIPEQEKNALISQARLGWSLSYEEGWGLSVNEFLAASLPVVAYDLPIFAHVFPGQLELTKLGDKEDMAAKTLRLLENESRLREMGRAGRQFVARYDYRNVAKAELDAILKIGR